MATLRKLGTVLAERSPKYTFTKNVWVKPCGVTKCVNFLTLAPERYFSASHDARYESRDWEIVPGTCDICIVGGGVMGLSAAFWLKEHEAGRNLRVVVLERDPNYKESTSALSVGGYRQQFSLRENIEMSQFGAHFLKNINDYLGIEGRATIDVQLQRRSYVFLASTPQGAECLMDNYTLQKKLGCKVELLSPVKLKTIYPFMNNQDVELACHGLENEGWFDPWSLLHAFRKKAISLGVKFVPADVTGFKYNSKQKYKSYGPNVIVMKTSDGKSRQLEFQECVIAAGHNSGKVAKLAGIGVGKGVLSYPVLVEPRKRYVYYVHCPDLLDNTKFPLVIDFTKTWARSEGPPGYFLVGKSPEEEEEPPADNLEVDYDYFESEVWPLIANRVPAFENLKIKSAYGAYYDYNTFDQNGIIGTHPAFKNIHFVTGFSGHGIQQSPAAGRAVAELILHRKFITLDLERFGFRRLIDNQKVLEQNII